MFDLWCKHPSIHTDWELTIAYKRRLLQEIYWGLPVRHWAFQHKTSRILGGLIKECGLSSLLRTSRLALYSKTKNRVKKIHNQMFE